MGSLSKYFRRSEFACGCGCGWDTVDASLIRVLDRVRYHYNAPVLINSGCRCTVHNRAVGGSARSQHRFGKAADIVVMGVPAPDVAKWVDNEFHDQLGLGTYETFTHIDVRDKKARWHG